MAKKKADSKPKGPKPDEQPVLPRGGSGQDDASPAAAPLPEGTKAVKIDQMSDIGAAKAGQGAVVDEDADPSETDDSGEPNAPKPKKKK